MHKNVQRIDHFAWIVRPENYEACKAKLTAVLGLNFVDYENPDLAIKIALDWDAGIEILSPTDMNSHHGRLLEAKGEGMNSLIFGVEDLDAALDRAVAAGAKVTHDIDSSHMELANRFDVLREAFFEEDIFGVAVRLGQLDPKQS